MALVRLVITWCGLGLLVYFVVQPLSGFFDIGTGLRFVDWLILLILFEESLGKDTIYRAIDTAFANADKQSQERIEALQEELEEADRALGNRIDWLDDNVKLKPSPLN